MTTRPRRSLGLALVAVVSVALATPALAAPPHLSEGASHLAQVCQGLHLALLAADGRHAQGLVLGNFMLVGSRKAAPRSVDCEFRASVKNRSYEGGALAVAAQLTSESPDIEVVDGAASFGVIPPRGHASAGVDTFTVRLSLRQRPRPNPLRWTIVISPDLAVIGAQGGTLASTDGRLRLDFPAGALVADTVITAAPRSVPAEAGFVGGLVYELGPDGVVFAQPVRLTLGYDPAALSGPETSLRIAKLLEGGVGEFADNTVVDTSLHTVAGSLSSFSSYGTTAVPRAFDLRAELQADRSIRVSWTSGGGSLTVERATCIYPQVCGTPVPIEPADSSFGYFASGSRGEVFDLNVPPVSAVYWYRIRSATRVFPAEYVVIFGLPTAPSIPTGFRATPEANGDILLTWDRSADPDVRFVLTREVCGLEEPLADLPGLASSFLDSRSSGLAPGARYTYRLSAYNNAGSSGHTENSATSVVAADECQGFTLGLASCAVEVPAGGSTTVEVEIRRTASPLGVELSLEPFGDFELFLDHSFAPQAPKAGNSVLRLANRGGWSPVSATIHGRDDGGTTCSTPLAVRFTGADVPVALTTYRNRAPANALWAARRVGDGSWEALQGSSGRYDFTASALDGGRYSVAVACDASNVTLLELTTSETTAPSLQCPSDEPTYVVQGALQGVPAAHCVRVSIGDRLPPGCHAQGYAARVGAGTHDLIAAIEPLAAPLTPDAVRLVRDLAVSADMTLDLDLAGAVATRPALVRFTPFAASASVFFRTANSARTLVGSGFFGAQLAYGGVPVANQRAGDLHELAVSGLDERRIFFRAPDDHVVDLSSPLAWSTPTVSSAPSGAHRRMTLTAERVAAANGYEIGFDSFQGDEIRSWRTFVSTGWLDASGLQSPFVHTTADLSSAPGFDPAWGLLAQPDEDSYRITAHSGNGTLTTLLQVIAGQHGSVGDGYNLRSAVRTGSVP